MSTTDDDALDNESQIRELEKCIWDFHLKLGYNDKDSIPLSWHKEITNPKSNKPLRTFVYDSKDNGIVFSFIDQVNTRCHDIVKVQSKKNKLTLELLL
jgi:hypothetical protein